MQGERSESNPQLPINYKTPRAPERRRRFDWVTAVVAIPCILWTWGMFAFAIGQPERAEIKAPGVERMWLLLFAACRHLRPRPCSSPGGCTGAGIVNGIHN